MKGFDREVQTSSLQGVKRRQTEVPSKGFPKRGDANRRGGGRAYLMLNQAETAKETEGNMFAFMVDVRYRIGKVAGELRDFLKHAEVLGVRYAIGTLRNQASSNQAQQDLGSRNGGIRNLIKSTRVNEANVAVISTNGRRKHRRPVDDFPGIGGSL